MKKQRYFLGNRRSRLRIIADILKISRDGTPKTLIVRRANLSSTQLEKYLSFLFESKLIEKITTDETTIYKTTPRGGEYLQSFKVIRDLLRL